MLTRKLVVLIAALLFAWPLQAAQQTIYVGTSADKKSLDTNFGNAQANFVELYGWVDQGVKTTSSPSFVSVTATGGTLRAGVANTTQGALVLHTNTDPIYTFGLMPAATPSEIVSLKAPPAMPGGSNYLWNVDADGTGGWTDPATFQADLAVPSQSEAETGTATTERVWTAERVKQAIVALGGGSGLTSLPTADNQILQATGSGTYEWTLSVAGLIDDTAGNGDTDKLWSADRVFDQLALKTATIASGTSALGTGAISSGACAAAVTTAATGTLTTDVINWGFNGDPTGVTGYAPTANGMLTIIAYPTADNVNYKVCNLTAASITPGAITLNWRIQR